ncbi:MAG: ABC transporter permease [Prevotellaceae bacterium]|nr:ABC transporter permease [Prevotellaceae bacterium]
MLKYLLKRLVIGLITILIAFTLTFFLTRVAPGNPIRVLAGKENPNPEQIAYLTEYYGLDQPLHIQFVTYIQGLLRGDFGRSIVNNRPVTDMIRERIIPTLALSFTAMLLSTFLGTLLGLVAGKQAGSRLDRILCNISYIIDAIPSFWLSMMFIIFFAVRLGWLPTGGMYSFRETYTGLARLVDLVRHMILPVSVLVIIQMPYYFRVSRASVRSILNEDFIKTLRAGGVMENRIYRKYVLRNAIIPVITAFSLSLSFVLAGAAMVEIVFAWPGMGRVIIDAVTKRDYAVLSGIYLMLSISVTFFMIVSDVVYAVVDPRIHLT